MTNQTSVFLQMFTAIRQNSSNLSSLFYDVDPMQRLYATTGGQIQKIQSVPLATEPGISLIILTSTKIL